MRLHTERAGTGLPVLLLHGLTATNRYVVMGSRALERAGHDVIAYDARGHGASDPAPSPPEYTYADLASDVSDQLDAAGVEAAVIAGSSMGAHTAVRFALDQPDRVLGLVLITPAYLPGSTTAADLAEWDSLSDGFRHGGVEGFIAAYTARDGITDRPDTVVRVLRQRMVLHQHPDAVADALKAVPRSEPFAALTDLQAIHVPTVVVADHDGVDPGHPLAVGEAWAEALPDAELVVEEPGQSPIAWQGGAVSRIIAEVGQRAREDHR